MAKLVDKIENIHCLPHVVRCYHDSLYALPNQWINENLIGIWSFAMVNTPHLVDYYFELEEDAVAFKLRWL